MLFCDFLPERWRMVLKNRISAKIYYEASKNLAESFRNFRRKTGMFSIFGGGKPLPSPP
jgi:hypothetical protein